MKKLITNYSLKNKQLKTLENRARLEIVLKGEVSDKTVDKIREIINCQNCKWYQKDGRVYGRCVTSCRKPGTKSKNLAYLYLPITRSDGSDKYIRLAIPYCTGFEEKKD